MSEPVAAEDLRDEYLWCRTVGHSWEEVVADDLPRPEHGWRMALQCSRCLTRRNQIIDDRTGDAEGRRYDYPEGYKLDEKATRSEMRLEYSKRRQYDFIAENRTRRSKKK